MMIGLPRSGKSTIAKKISKDNGWPIVSSDAMRLAVHGQRWWGPGEPQVWATVKLMVAALFHAGHTTIILDSTNVDKKLRDEWLAYCDEIEYIYVNTMISVCKQRAIDTGQSDLELKNKIQKLFDVIDRMLEKLELPLDENENLRVICPGNSVAE